MYAFQKIELLILQSYCIKIVFGHQHVERVIRVYRLEF